MDLSKSIAIENRNMVNCGTQAHGQASLFHNMGDIGRLDAIPSLTAREEEGSLT